MFAPRKSLTVDPTESTSVAPVITWPTWLAWVLVAALGPALSTIAATAADKQILRDAQHRELISNGLLVIIAFGILAPPVMQALVLKRVVPKLSVAIWFFCVLLSGTLWFMLLLGRHGWALVDAGFQTQHRLQDAGMTLRLAGTLNTAQILGLPWGPFMLWTIATSALTSLAPAWALGTASGRRSATLLFFAAPIVGACVSIIVEQLYRITVDDHALIQWALNGLSWTKRFHVLALRSGVGAVWGAATAILVVLMTRQSGNIKDWTFATHRVGGLALVLIAPLLIAILAPLFGYLAGPHGIVAGAPELRRAISLAPSQDSSQGETVLTYSHDIEIPVARMPVVVIALDGQNAIVRSIDHTLVQVDLATGRNIRQLAGALAPLERHSIVWSPDGRYLALRSHGAGLPIPNTRYTGHQGRVRLYALPDLTLLGEFSNSEGACFDSFAREPMLFSNDSKSLWMVCGQQTALTSDDLMAIRLDVPAMQAPDIRRYGGGAESEEIGGLERIGDSVWAWQSGRNSKPFRVSDLTHRREVAAVPTPNELIGEMTEQTGLSKVDEKNIQRFFCGTPPGVPADAGPTSWICRTLSFDTRTGALLASVDKPDHRHLNGSHGLPNYILSGHGLSIESFWPQDSKAGELVVRDSATGRERQRIASIAQRPLQISADGVWLMTSAIHSGGLRLYRIHR